ncbi:hypothetical protein Poly30_43150 [Planctomycetes bacterium Poly30]|uniref:Cortical protein marker for cell polarity n=1 Tax=Saltatorellus ferox TaxID=2528018 RepID=A0A518EXE8_9BACT|nr:hypothetical protein Poly30_43150 [Planctomycetes bacterium Poly30]
MAFLLCAVLVSQVGFIDRSPDDVFEIGSVGSNQLFGADVALHDEHLLIGTQNYRVGGQSVGRVDFWKQTGTGFVHGETFYPIGCHYLPTTSICGFGYRVALRDGHAAVGSWGGDPFNHPESSGLVHLYSLTQSGWGLRELIRAVPNPSNDGSNFGGALSISGDWLAVGAPGYAALGGVHLYDLHGGGTSRHAQTLLPVAQTASGAFRFGSQVEIEGQTLAVSEPGPGGRVYVYREVLGVWSLHQLIYRPGGPNFNREFGARLALDTDNGVLAVADENLSGVQGSGSVYIYELDRASDRYLLVKTLRPTEGGLGGNPAKFGSALSVSDGILAIGSTGQTVQVKSEGACEIYRRGEFGWRFSGRLIPPPTLFWGQALGRAVGVSNGRVLVSDSGWTNPAGVWTGRTYLWEIPSAAGLCEDQLGGVTMNICRVDDVEHLLDVSIRGVAFDGYGLLASGLPVAPQLGGLANVCLGQPHRVTTAIPLTAGSDNAVVRLSHPNGSFLPGTAFQFIYRRSQSGQPLTAGPSAVLFE